MRSSRRLLAVAAACTAALVACGGADDLGPLWVPTDAVVADVDGDGRNDVLTLAMFQPAGFGSEEGHLLVYLQTPTPGVFAAPLSHSVGRYPWRAVLAEIDGDGKPDLVITDPDAETAWLLLQDAAQPGRFLAPQPLVTGPFNYSAAVVDLNADGAPDVAVDGAGKVVIRYQDPAMRGTFGPQTELALPGRPSLLAGGDIDGDTLADLLAWVYTNPAGTFPPSAGFGIAYQKPGGGFDVAGPIAPQVGLNAGRLAIADVNADGRRDLFAFLTPSSSAFAAQLTVAPQTATARAFADPVTTVLLGVRGVDDAVLADLDQDTIPDVAVAGFFPVGSPTVVRSRVNLLLNNGTGAFALSAQIEMPSAVSRIAAGDLNADGRNDLVLLDGDNQALVMFQSAPGAFLPPRALR